MKKKTRVDTDQTLVFMKRFSDPIVKMLVKTPVTPLHIAIFSFTIFAPLTAYLLIMGGRVNNFLALIILIAHSFFDLMDGELARQKRISSRLGIWFEYSLDPLMQLIVIMSVIANVIITNDVWWRYLILLALFGQSYANILGVILTEKFRVDPLTGNKLLNESVGKSKKTFDIILKNIMVPSHPFFVIFLTMRFYLIFGILLNQLAFAFIVFGFAIITRALLLYLILTFYYTNSNTSRINKYAVFRYLRAQER